MTNIKGRFGAVVWAIFFLGILHAIIGLEVKGVVA